MPAQHFEQFDPILPSEEFRSLGQICVGDGVIRDGATVIYSETQQIYDEWKAQIQAESREIRLRQNRNYFGALVALAVIALAVSFYLSLPYEPALAILFSVAGIFVVFQMKLSEMNNAARRQEAKTD
jgi:hypothetical protein